MRQNAGNEFYRFPILNRLELFHARDHKANFPFHCHPTFNITLVLDRTFTTQLPDQFLQAPCGSLFVTNPDEIHATPCESIQGNSFYTFYVSPDVLKKLNFGQPVFFKDKTIYDPALFANLYQIATTFHYTNFSFEAELTHSLERLIQHAAAELRFEEKQTTMFRQFIKQTSFEKFSLELTAREFGLDKFKFLRLFKQETGLTPNNFIILQRIEKSKELLQSSADLLEIALETGFYDATHFSKHFKRVTGISPGTFRNA